ncbi:MAG: hypothetical protein A2X49_01950 [Lentisphaerae bacterium GWF2_52_8]|nr:MAG: hypothetical protein A2X49_01950 [Lentisphaerae bacterium GWF2_52_8]
MLCKICQKNPATIHIQEIINGEKKSLHICAECAAKKSKDDPLLQGFNIAEMLYSLSSQIPPASIQEDEKKDEAPSSQVPVPSCKVCGWDALRFRKSGRLGCAHCYEVFKDVLGPALNNMHRGTLHVGKQLGGQHNKSGKLLLRIMGLQKELDEFVRREEYEKAAELRDKISVLKKTMEA